jgi:phosphate butyryltransferase
LAHSRNVIDRAKELAERLRAGADPKRLEPSLAKLATLDARLLERMARSGEFGDAIVQGPLALDDAVSRDVVRTKAISGPVAGRADILLAPEIETANCLYKALTCFAGLEGASIIGGASAPIVLPARADSARMKFLSIAFAAAMTEA